MSRRVPKQIPSRANLFNYIPQMCPEYKKRKKCAMGNECYLAHGWLEIIYHPLLFKTKLCKSSLEKGVCRKYGFYCAKAHNKNEVRNLVSIYGEDWKRHYEAHQSESVMANNKEAKLELSKHSDLSNSSRSSGSRVEDNVKSAGLGDYSSLMYGGSPLFVPTPLASPCQSVGLCSQSPIDNIPSIILSDIDHVECGEVGMYSKICKEGANIVASNQKKTQCTHSLFNDIFLWAFDWSSSKDTSPKQSVCSSSVTDDLKSTFKESNSWASGSTIRMTDVDTELFKTKEDCRFKDATNSGMTYSDNSSDDQAMNRSLQDFDQLDWEFKLRQDEHGNELNTYSICPPAGKDECEIPVD